MNHLGSLCLTFLYLEVHANGQPTSLLEGSIQYLLSSYCVSGLVQGAGNTKRGERERERNSTFISFLQGNQSLERKNANEEKQTVLQHALGSEEKPEPGAGTVSLGAQACLPRTQNTPLSGRR